MHYVSQGRSSLADARASKSTDGVSTRIWGVLKSYAALLPQRWQATLKRIHFGRLIATQAFTTDEPEYAMLDKWISPGDWVVDIGANVGHYTYRLSSLVGATGRVLAFEPVPDSFALLTATAQRCAHANVTLINAAVSDCAGVAGMSIPTRTNGLSDYYQAHLIASRGGGLSVLTMPLDTMCQGHRIALVKIDVEGHEASVVSGMSPHRSVEARANRRNGIAGRDRSPRGDGVYR